jgi:phosphodiesterase/alkaline phosphatase D-like protein
MSFRPSGRQNFPIDRRQLMGYLGAGCLGLMAGPAVTGRAAAQAPRWTADPFSLGVAAGGPRPDGVVLWTRLAPARCLGLPRKAGLASDLPVPRRRGT